MQAYLVRIKESRELVGFYAARSLEDLADLIDEVMDPHECECTVIGRGGIAWGKTKLTIPPKMDDDDDKNPLPLHSAEISEDWFSKALDEKSRWKDVPHSWVCDTINATHGITQNFEYDN